MRNRGVKPCLHCGRQLEVRARGLCHTCWKHSREDYELAAPREYQHPWKVDFNGDAPLPEPTQHRPGSPGKHQVLHERALARQALWHPGDAGWQPEGTQTPAEERAYRERLLAALAGEEDSDGS